MDEVLIQECREWIARHTAILDQREKRYQMQYDFTPPQINLERMEDIEALRFWINIHSWELDQMIQTNDDYPQSTNND